MVSLLLVATAAMSATKATPTYRSSPERRIVVDREWGPWLGSFRARNDPSLMQDFGERYLPTGQRCAAAAATRRAAGSVLGDSITDGWNLAASFPDRPYVNRGIGSQVTAQMLLRFHQDMIALRPAAVVILAGVNDLSGEEGLCDMRIVEAIYRSAREGRTIRLDGRA